MARLLGEGVQDINVKWVYLTTAPDQLQAEMWSQILVNEGVPAMVRPSDTVTFLGVSARPCRILVAEDRLERAKDVMEMLGDHL